MSWVRLIRWLAELTVFEQVRLYNKKAIFVKVDLFQEPTYSKNRPWKWLELEFEGGGHRGAKVDGFKVLNLKFFDGGDDVFS